MVAGSVSPGSHDAVIGQAKQNNSGATALMTKVTAADPISQTHTFPFLSLPLPNPPPPNIHTDFKDM